MRPEVRSAAPALAGAPFLVVLLSALFLASALTGCSSLPSFKVSGLPPSVRVEDHGDWIALLPSSGTPRQTGLLYYPGGFVAPLAYLEILAPLAEAGYPVFIVRMPFDLAFFAPDRGFEIIAKEKPVKRWVIAGHSLGGVAAAIAVHDRPGVLSGIAFWASYPPDSADLSGTAIRGLSISGSMDGLSTPAKLAKAAPLLPKDTTTIVIEGGNHAQFGSYGRQRGDGEAAIPATEQQAEVAQAMLAFMATIPE
jgi:pimeloyl-ACP methyl ester carboxylesterase